jgi:hypothetical protein
MQPLAAYRVRSRRSADEVTMNPDLFDAVARSLAPSHSRRAIIGIAAGAMTVLVGSGSIGVDARQRAKKKCKAGEKKCKNKCCKRGDICAKGVCVTGKADCANNDDACETGGASVLCNCGQKMGLCFQRLQGGVRCSIELGGKTGCDQCRIDADCHALGFPPGSSCVKDSGPFCPLCSAADARGKCVAPCNAEA